jgi:hypothetical protein
VLTSLFLGFKVFSTVFVTFLSNPLLNGEPIFGSVRLNFLGVYSSLKSQATLATTENGFN